MIDITENIIRAMRKANPDYKQILQDIQERLNKVSSLFTDSDPEESWIRYFEPASPQFILLDKSLPLWIMSEGIEDLIGTVEDDRVEIVFVPNYHDFCLSLDVNQVDLIKFGFYTEAKDELNDLDFSAFSVSDLFFYTV